MKNTGPGSACCGAERAATTASNTPSPARQVACACESACPCGPECTCPPPCSCGS